MNDPFPLPFPPYFAPCLVFTLSYKLWWQSTNPLPYHISILTELQFESFTSSPNNWWTFISWIIEKSEAEEGRRRQKDSRFFSLAPSTLPLRVPHLMSTSKNNSGERRHIEVIRALILPQFQDDWIVSAITLELERKNKKYHIIPRMLGVSVHFYILSNYQEIDSLIPWLDCKSMGVQCLSTSWKVQSFQRLN